MELNAIRNSGNLELYVLGELTSAENEDIENAIALFPELKIDLLEIERSLEIYAMSNAKKPSPAVLPMLLAQANYSDRLANGYIPSSAPDLNEKSRVKDFNKWIQRSEFKEPLNYESMAGRIICSNEEKTSMIIWLKEGAPPEIHTDEIEKFLIVEGSCDITIGDKVHSLVAGDFLEIPLYISHSVRVTSTNRCKIILERKAA